MLIMEYTLFYSNNYCGAREFVILAHFTLGPKARAEEKRCRGHATEDIAEDDSVLGIPKPRRKERYTIKGRPQSVPRRKDEYSIEAVQGKTKHLHIDGEMTPEQCGDKGQGKGCYYCN